MKKVLILVSVLIFSLGCIAYSYIGWFCDDVPSWKQKQYKAEMERIIHKALPKAHVLGQDDIKAAKEYRDKIIENNLSNDSEECINLGLVNDFIESDILLSLYADLVNASSKYFKVDKNVTYTDWWVTPSVYIEPYLIKHKVNMYELKKLQNYATQQRKIVVQYIKDTDKYCHIYTNQRESFED